MTVWGLAAVSVGMLSSRPTAALAGGVVVGPFSDVMGAVMDGAGAAAGA